MRQTVCWWTDHSSAHNWMCVPVIISCILPGECCARAFKVHEMILGLWLNLVILPLLLSPSIFLHSSSPISLIYPLLTRDLLLNCIDWLLHHTGYNGEFVLGVAEAVRVGQGTFFIPCYEVLFLLACLSFYWHTVFDLTIISCLCYR